MKNRAFGRNTFYIMTIFVLLSSFSYAIGDRDEPNITTKLTTIVQLGQEKNALEEISKRVEIKKRELLKTQKSDTIKYTTLYDTIAQLLLVKNQLLIEIGREDEEYSSEVCNFVLDYQDVEFLKTEFYKTPFHDDIATTLSNIAALYSVCHPPMAERYLNSLLKIKEHIYGKKSAEAAIVYDLLGDHYRLVMANFVHAIRSYKKANLIREQLYGLNDIRVTQNYHRLAISLFYHGQKSQAKKLIVKSLHIYKSDKNLSQLSLAKVLMQSVDFYDMLGEYSHSLAYLKEAEEILVSLKREKSPEMIALCEKTSNIYLNQGDEKASQEYLKKASLLKEKKRR